MRIMPAIATLIFGGASIAGTINPEVPDEKHIEYGTRFKSVARIICFDGEPSVNLYSASCVIVSPTHILTAAHVVANSTNWVVVQDDGSQRTLTAMTLHPLFSSTDATVKGRFDIAVGRADKEFSLDEFPKLYEKSDEKSRLSSTAGYGFKGTFASGQRDCDGKKRAGTNIIDYIEGDDMLVCSATRVNMTDMEFLIASGDSGGGLFIDGSLAGINSCVMAIKRRPDSSWGDESGHTRISSHLDWIKKEMNCDGK